MAGAKFRMRSGVSMTEIRIANASAIQKYAVVLRELDWSAGLISCKGCKEDYLKLSEKISSVCNQKAVLLRLVRLRQGPIMTPKADLCSNVCPATSEPNCAVILRRTGEHR